MKTYEFYKSVYDRELSRRITLDESINIPITVLTLIIGLNSFFIDQDQLAHLFKKIGILEIITILTSLAIFICIYFIIKSYNNLFKGFSYRNVALTSKIRKYETSEIPNYNNHVDEEDKIDFDNELINEIILVADNHTLINDKRSLNLYRAKTFLIIALLLTIFRILLITYKINRL